MGDRLNSFALNVLTGNKEVTLRRLRSYAASLGGSGQVFHSYESLQQSLEATLDRCPSNVILYDSSLHLTPMRILKLARYGRLFVLQPPNDRRLITIPDASAPCWRAESYLQCSLSTLLESPIIRVSMAQMCKGVANFHLSQLLRWGHTATTWHSGRVANDQNGQSVVDTGLAFIRKFRLEGEARRVAEMFAHFLQVRLPHLKIQKDAVTFGTDGLLVAGVAHCHLERGQENIRDLVEELSIHSFPTAIVNRLEGPSVEIAALHYPAAFHNIQTERMVLYFNKQQEHAKSLLYPPTVVEAS